MNINMEQEIVKQLSSIKRWIAIAVIMLLIALVSIVSLSIWTVVALNDTVDEFSEDFDEDGSWKDLAYDAIDEANYKIAIELAENRINTHPNDSDAFYIKAQVAFYLGNLEEAKKLLLHTKALAPSWDAKYIKPLQEAIEQNAYNKELNSHRRFAPGG